MSSPAYGPRFDAACAYAIDAFRHTYRKQTTIPYITHLFAVAATVGEYGGDEDQIIAALLHDVLEDVEGSSAEDLEARFGSRVSKYVVALTDTTLTPKPPWRARKEAYLAHLRHEPAELKLISAADKLHNCRSVARDHNAIGEAIFDRFTAPKHETLWYFRAVCDSLGDGWDHPILDELRAAVHALHEISAEKN